MARDRAGTGLLETLVAGTAVALAGCGSDESVERSADALSTTQQALVNVHSQGVPASRNSAGLSRLDIRPPPSALAVSSMKNAGSDASFKQAAQTFATQNASRYGVDAGTVLDVLSIRRSLLGVHVTLQEKVGGIPVAGSTFTVSFDNNSGGVYRVHSSVFLHQHVTASNAQIDEDAAYDVAWRRLGVTGKLQGRPSATLTYVPDLLVAGQLLLVYRVELPVSAPSGAWRVDVDATSGAVVAVEDLSLPRNKVATLPPVLGSQTVAVADRRAAFAEAFAREAAKADSKVAEMTAKATVNGTGLVFDPDPVTTLRDTTLADDSPASAFEDAYIAVALLDITQTSGVYHLEGPWAKIVDWESPSTAPSTTTNGNWSARRGDNAFNDVMSYYHIDRNQRYIQSLGFTGSKGIQNIPIEVDSDGFSGADNSHYDPSTNRLAYGHGYVDDNEDLDVILHEYMHALTYAINSSWGGGDMRALGEGFGDYWGGGSNVDSFPAGFDNAKVYTWDGNNGYGGWSGRRMDLTSLIYDPTQTYYDHQPIPGGSSDELWSTPLFQALLALRAVGVPKKQVDTILLEAQFGLGASITMRQMATAIVDTAKRLYPLGPHAGILSRKFHDQNILEAVDWNLFAATFVPIVSQYL